MHVYCASEHSAARIANDSAQRHIGTSSERQVMFYRKLRKRGNSYVVTIPKEEVERLNLQVGQLLLIHIQRAEISDEIRKAMEESWKRQVVYPFRLKFKRQHRATKCEQWQPRGHGQNGRR